MSTTEIEPTAEEQERFWALQARYLRARQDFEDFGREHEGKSFRVFRPGDIYRAVTDEIEPLDFPGFDWGEGA